MLSWSAMLAYFLFNHSSQLPRQVSQPNPGRENGFPPFSQKINQLERQPELKLQLEAVFSFLSSRRQLSANLKLLSLAGKLIRDFKFDQMGLRPRVLKAGGLPIYLWIHGFYTRTICYWFTLLYYNEQIYDLVNISTSQFPHLRIFGLLCSHFQLN